MQVSTRLAYPDPGASRQRQRLWTNDPVPPVRADERGGGYRGNLSRTPHQPVNDRLPGDTADKEVFVARSLTSTLAMLQMHVVPDSGQASDASPPMAQSQDNAQASFIEDLFSGVLATRNPQ